MGWLSKAEWLPSLNLACSSYREAEPPPPPQVLAWGPYIGLELLCASGRAEVPLMRLLWSGEMARHCY